jgi:hypothetical protein
VPSHSPLHSKGHIHLSHVLRMLSIGQHCEMLRGLSLELLPGHKAKLLIDPTPYISEVSNVISDLVWRRAPKYSIVYRTVPVTDP